MTRSVEANTKISVVSLAFAGWLNVPPDEDALHQDVLSQCAIKHGVKLVLHESDDLQASVDLFWFLNTDTGRNLYVLAQTSEERQVFVAFSSVLARAINARWE